LADLLAIPEEKRRHELIGGDLVEKEAASGRHGGAQLALGHLLFPFRRRAGGDSPGGWWFASEAEDFFDADHTFRPDVAGWRRERLSEPPDTIPIRVRPDWVCEILSTNRRNDLIRKKRIYHQYGVPHYWIIDPAEETLAVERWSPDGYIEVLVAERGERVSPEPFAAIEFSVGVLFGDDE